MANIRNIDAEVGANFIGDDAQPTLRIENSSTGPALSADKLLITSTATVVSNTTTGVPVTFSSTVLSGPTTARATFVASTASAPVFELKGQSYVSAVSLIFAAGSGWAGMGAIRVKRPDGTLGWIPVLPDAQVTGAVFS